MNCYTDEVRKRQSTTVNELGGRQSRLSTRCDLLPPRASLRLAEVLAGGAEKYGEDNWHAISEREHIAHALEHVYRCLDGETGGEDHLAHAACRMVMALEIRERGGPRRQDGNRAGGWWSRAVRWVVRR